MKQPLEQKYTVAWFKLAEFVARGEKERALGMYRLLAHSLNDQALAYQLEGDLLASFNDTNAYSSYQSAAKLYHERMLFAEAAALYEQLSEKYPVNDEYLRQLVLLYVAQQDEEPVVRSLTRLVQLYTSQAALSALQMLTLEVERFFMPHAFITVLEPFIILLSQTEQSIEEIAHYVEKLKGAYIKIGKIAVFENFVNHLKNEEPTLQSVIEQRITT